MELLVGEVKTLQKSLNKIRNDLIALKDLDCNEYKNNLIARYKAVRKTIKRLNDVIVKNGGESMVKKTILLTDYDLDGIGCAAFMIANDLVDKIYVWDYAEITPEILAEGEVIVCDLNFPVIYDDVTIYDHSPANEGRIKKGIWDPNRCAAKIIYDEILPYHSKAMDRFAYLIDTYERWVDDRTDFPIAVDFNRLRLALMGISSKKIPIYDEGVILETGYKQLLENMLGLLGLESFEFSDEQEALIDGIKAKEDAEYAKELEHVQERTDSKGVKFLISHFLNYTSILINRLLNEKDDATYCLNINTRYWSMNARSKTGFNLLKLNGLTGQENAASCTWSSYSIKKIESGEIYEMGYRKEE